MKHAIKEGIRALVPGIYGIGRHFMKKGGVLSMEEAMGILHRHSPDPAGDCLWDNPLPEPEYDLAVIIPVYNAERYLDQCLTSVLGQDTRYSFRVIAVDDGSTDSSPDILKRYWADERLSIIRQENAGASAARNAALRGVESRYVLFLDSDDYLVEGAIEALLDAAVSRDADIVQGSYSCFRDRDGQKIYDRRFTDGEGEQALAAVSGMVGGKLYRSRLFEKVRFPQGYWYEDTVIWLLTLPMAGKVATVSHGVFRYRRHDASNTGAQQGKAKTLDTCYVTLAALTARERLGMKPDGGLYRRLLRQVVINCKRTGSEPDYVKKSVFSISHRILTTYRPEPPAALNDWERKLEEAVLEGNYTGYTLLCRSSRG